MPADYALCRDIMRACREAHPTGPHFTVHCREFPEDPARNVRYDGKTLKDRAFQVDKLRAIAGDATFESVQWIRHSHPLAAEQFPENAKEPAN